MRFTVYFDGTGNGLSNTDTHLGKNLEIGKNVDSATHLVATNEYRDTFRLTSALRNNDNSRIEEIKFAGAAGGDSRLLGRFAAFASGQSILRRLHE